VVNGDHLQNRNKKHQAKAPGASAPGVFFCIFSGWASP